MAVRTKRDPKQMKAWDVSITLGRYITSPTVETTARALAAYFKGGGPALRYEEAIEIAIGVLYSHTSETRARAQIEAFDERSRVPCLQVFEAILKAYAGRISSCTPIASKLVKVRDGIGVHLPPGLLAKVDGMRRFIIFQPRRGKAPHGERAGFLLSMFNEKYSINEEYGVMSEMLDMRCLKGSKQRLNKIIKSEEVRQFAKEKIDSNLAVHVDAMQRLIKDPKRYGVSADVSRDWQIEMEEFWAS